MANIEEEEKEAVPTFQNNRVPLFLKMTYIILPLWGIWWFYLFWNGSTTGFLDRGFWPELQEAANTKFPETLEEPIPPPKETSK